ncbi:MULTISPECIES: type VI secretion system lipoprotein TssJ [Pseudomonas]|uniref:type VI secretion system lipoprotein TssJ n=1 Tax=Pseudomonas TaxID=286 RepID=UPI002360E914|nr:MULTISPECIES: type VI secretion system lipoprotein TssJ [Pseudomonas]WJV25563.1 type VI secretion system lipoprotein TssJ [Pseudomonas chlororaphis]
MKRALSVLLMAAILSGCTTVGNVFKKTGQILMDPSIQVGAADDQPSEVALSLYAGPDVNPNAESVLPEAAATDEPPGVAASSLEGPFAISLNSPNRSGLIESLRTLLAHLESDAELPTTLGPESQEAYPQVVAIRTGTKPTGLPSESEAASYDEAMSLYGHSPSPLPVSASNVPHSPDGLAPGQYRASTSLPDDPAVGLPTSRSATPIAFRIVQLKDDSMLLNASADQLQQNMKKALGSTYLSADDYVLVPGQYKFINFRPIAEEANYIAVVADFRDPSEAVWKEVFRLEPKGRKYALLIALQGTRVSIIDESFRPVQTPPPSRKQ